MMTRFKTVAYILNNCNRIISIYCYVVFLLLYSEGLYADELLHVKQDVAEMDARNFNVEFSVSASDENLKFCVNDISDNTSSFDVFRVFLHTAVKLSHRTFEHVYLCFRGEDRYFIEGVDYQELGKEYETQNPIVTIRTFPQMLKLLSGERAFKVRRGGLLFVMRVQMEDFREMSNQWYLNDIQVERAAKLDELRPIEFADETDIF